MIKSKRMMWIITIVLLVVAGLWIRKNFFSTKTKTTEFVHGPFTIRMEQFTTSDFNMNYGKFFDRVHIAYSVWCNGELVPYPADLQVNTGFSHLWRVYIVKDAPQPTLFAGSQSLFMITTKNDGYEVLPLNVQSSDFITFQWLDAKDGQPDTAFELFMANEKTSMKHPDTLQGGEYLMVKNKLVIHVPTLQMFLFNTNNDDIDNYGIGANALAFSPDKQVVVFPANFQTWNSNDVPTYGKALISYDFRKDKGAVLPYSQNDTRLYRDEDLNMDWFNTYFTWDTSGTATQLAYNPPLKPALWQGYFKETAYYLYPVDDGMLSVFKQFILDYMQWPPEAILTEKYHEYTGRNFQLGVGKAMFYLVGKEGEVHLMPDLYEEVGDSTMILIKDIGRAFNEELKKGNHQDHFTAIPENEKY